MLSKQVYMITGILLLPVLLFPAIKPSLHFKHLTSQDGLSSSHVTSVIQDDDGFIWIATMDGLNRFDGYHFEIYRASQKDTLSLINNMVQTLFRDRSGALWIGTVQGINRYNKEMDSFNAFTLNSEDVHSNWANSVKSFAQDREGNLYTHSEEGFIYRFDPTHQQFVLFDSTNFGYVQKILIDQNDVLWIGSHLGLTRYDLSNKQTEVYLRRRGNKNFSGNFIISLCEVDSTIWAGTELYGIFTIHQRTGKIGRYEMPYYRDRHIIDIYKDRLNRVWIGNNNGLKLYDRDSDLFHMYRHNPMEPQSLSQEAVSCIFVDDQENVWCGSVLGGINLSVKNKAFVNYEQNAEKTFALSGQIVSALMEDRRGDLWVGYYTDGIDVIRDGIGIIHHYPASRTDPSQLGVGTVFRIMEDFKGDIWIGTYQGGLQRLDRRTGKFQTFLYDPKNPASVGSNDIRWIEEDGPNGLWVTTHGGGLNYFDREKQQFIRCQENVPGEGAPLNLWPFISLEDTDHQVWIATPEGLSRFSPANQTFHHYYYLAYDTTSLSNNYVTSLFLDSQQRLWAGTNEGLNILNRERTAFRRLMMRQGLPNNLIQAVLEENDHEFWISTNSGLSHFNLNDDSVINYDIYDGIQANEFSPRTAIKRKNGQLLFGGINGLTAFYPDSIQNNPYAPPVYITAVRVHNRPVQIGELFNGKPILEKCARETDHLVLDYDNNMITFEYVGLNYIKSEKNRYACMLTGFHDDWLDMGEKREITFTNLHPGKYQFRVKACNNDGVWNEAGASINLTVEPPFWMTLPFRLVASIFAILILVLGYQLRVLSYRRQNIALSTVNKQLESEISERKKAEAQLSASLKEKEVLLREVHHRVKNNMQIISSLLNLQAHRITDPGLLGIFKGFQTRVRSMSLIYEKVYGSKDLAQIDLSEYIKAVTRYLFVTYRPTQQIRLDIEIKDVIVPVNKAMPCGLLVNELISNSLKFAFPDSAENPDPMIRIVMTRDKNEIRLSIDDNGIGYCETEEGGEKNAFLGINLIHLLVHDQLKGEMDVRCENGTHYTIRFSV